MSETKLVYAIALSNGEIIGDYYSEGEVTNALEHLPPSLKAKANHIFARRVKVTVRKQTNETN